MKALLFERLHTLLILVTGQTHLLAIQTDFFPNIKKMKQEKTRLIGSCDQSQNNSCVRIK